jgi:carbonic anhydrase
MPTTHSALALGALLCIGCAAASDDTTTDAELLERDLSHADDEGECPSGENQTPIDLPRKIALSEVDDLTFEYQNTHVAIINNGKTVQYTYDPGSVLWVGDERYELIQFHAHAHSEHALGGFLMPLEVHLVHKNEAEQLLVVGILVVRGRHNPTLDSAAWPELPTEEGEVVDDPDREFNVHDLIPGGPTYRYTGSLTAPPCSSDVSWIVYRRPISMSAEQLETFTDLYPHNARDLQDLGDRELVFGK